MAGSARAHPWHACTEGVQGVHTVSLACNQRPVAWVRDWEACRWVQALAIFKISFLKEILRFSPGSLARLLGLKLVVQGLSRKVHMW